MNKLIENLKTILPLTSSKIIFSTILFITCYVFSFLFINSLNISSVGLTLAINLIPAAITYLIITILIILIPKILKTQANKIQNFIIFNIVFAVELFVFSLTAFFASLISPLLFVILGILMLIGLCWLNIIFQYKFYAPITENNNELLHKIKLVNISILAVVLLIWFII